ncbi:uncharacterized protein LOC119596559 [Penaeus monodon]|uniref:uncharacterized protein LOC119596559 n=1 Tax=Penaeus monodon TaxID=6687 RepID=UPI0018A7BE01|nr:uncharacterized protein LOC119596559 [Penaeus monodon]
MKVTLRLLPLLAAAALATPTRYPVVSSVWPPRVHRPYFAPTTYGTAYDTTYDTTSSYATVPPSSFVPGSKKSSSASHPASFAFLNTLRRPSVPSFALAKAQESHPTYAPARSYGYAPAKKSHDFDFAVNEGGNNFGHQQSDDGYTTKGSYYVDLPDGRRQKVSYYVSGDSGFVAEVTYEGVAHYHAPKNNYHAQKPSYHAPKNNYHAQKPSYHAPSHHKPATTPAPAAYPPAPAYLVSSAHIPSPFHG